MTMATLGWNPLDWPGPEFLGFYVAVIVVATILTGWLRRRCEDGPAPRLGEADPVQIAFLRGGADEALRVALFGLLDRGVLAFANGRIGPGPKAGEALRGEFEPEVAAHFRVAAEPRTLFTPDRARWVSGRCEPELVRLGLLPGVEDRARRWGIVAGAAFVLLGLAVTKMSIGLERGRPVAFLVFLGLAAPLVAALPVFRRRTVRGDAMVNDLQRIFAGLRGDTLAAGAPEAALAAAVFGLGFLPESVWAWRSQVFPRASSGAGGTGCAGGCGSSGCGGSGCGGGGGCGGCGGD